MPHHEISAAILLARAEVDEESVMNSWRPTFSHSGVPYSAIDVKVRCFHSGTDASSSVKVKHKLSNDTQASFGITIALTCSVVYLSALMFISMLWTGRVRSVKYIIMG